MAHRGQGMPWRIGVKAGLVRSCRRTDSHQCGLPFVRSCLISKCLLAVAVLSTKASAELLVRSRAVPQALGFEVDLLHRAQWQAETDTQLQRRRETVPLTTRTDAARTVQQPAPVAAYFGPLPPADLAAAAQAAAGIVQPLAVDGIERGRVSLRQVAAAASNTRPYGMSSKQGFPTALRASGKPDERLAVNKLHKLAQDLTSITATLESLENARNRTSALAFLEHAKDSTGKVENSVATTAAPDSEAAFSVTTLVMVGCGWAVLTTLVAILYAKAKPHPPETTPGEWLIENGYWNFAIFQCMHEKKLTLFTCCCGAIRWADNMRMADFLSFWPAFLIAMLLTGPLGVIGVGIPLMLCLAVYYRQMLRRTFQMDHCDCWSICTDCCAYCFCTVCAIVQEARQIEVAYKAHHPELNPPPQQSPLNNV